MTDLPDPVENADAMASGAVARPPLTESHPPPPRPYGFWATLGLGFAGILILIAIGIAIVDVYVVLFAGLEADVDELMATIDADIFLLLLVSIITAIGLAGYLWLILHARGLNPARYLGLGGVTPRQLVWGLLSLAPVLAVATAVFWVVPDEAGLAWMAAVLEGADAPWRIGLLILTLVVVAPLMEEPLFRGFLVKGMAESRAGPVVAILLSSLLWMALHLQYNLSGMLAILLGGLYFGAVRHVTGSTTLCILLHAAWNAFSVGMMFAYFG